MFGKGGLGGVYPVVLPFLVVALAMLFGFCRAQHHERESLREELEQLQATIRQREKERDSALQELFLRFSEDGKLNKEKSLLFWFEIAMFVIAPVFLLSQSKVRNNPNALYGTCALVAMGFMANRLNVSITAFQASSGYYYIPKWTEFALTLATVTAAGVAFHYAVIYLEILPRSIPAKNWMTRHPAAA
jgi:Ni/Fe-hydrogenase subunit HybB-like protein